MLQQTCAVLANGCRRSCFYAEIPPMSMLHPAGGGKEPIQAAAQGTVPVARAAFPHAHCAAVVRLYGALVASI